jgi:hypothetical protein
MRCPEYGEFEPDSQLKELKSCGINAEAFAGMGSQRQIPASHRVTRSLLLRHRDLS